MGGFKKAVSLAKDKGIVKPVEQKAEQKNTKETEKEKTASQMLLAKRKGRRYSISTSAKGDLAKVDTKKKTLLG